MTRMFTNRDCELKTLNECLQSKGFEFVVIFGSSWHRIINIYKQIKYCANWYVGQGDPSTNYPIGRA